MVITEETIALFLGEILHEVETEKVTYLFFDKIKENSL